MSQVLFRGWESVDLLSNRVWHLFLSRIDGKSMEKLGSSRSPMEEREMSTFLFLGELNFFVGTELSSNYFVSA